MNFKLSTIFVIISITIAVQIRNVRPTANHIELNNVEEERKYIKQFYNYVDAIKHIMLDNMLKLTQDFAEKLLDSIPLGDRGNTAEVLYQYRVKAQRLRDQGAMIEEKENLLMELQLLINTIKSGLANREKEDIILRRGLMGMFELLARLSIEERKYNNKFSKAAILLQRRFSPEAVERHRGLFDLLHEINNETDIVAREKLFARFKEYKMQEI